VLVVSDTSPNPVQLVPYTAHNAALNGPTRSAPVVGISTAVVGVLIVMMAMTNEDAVRSNIDADC
jgi:flagellar motor component MotA